MLKYCLIGWSDRGEENKWDVIIGHKNGRPKWTYNEFATKRSI